MVRQCAWCLRLIDGAGERLSSSPLPKLYEASHGICSVCGTVWIARAIENETDQGKVNQTDRKEHNVSQMGNSPVAASGLPDSQSSAEAPKVQESQSVREAQPSITELILELQNQSRQKTNARVVKNPNRLRSY